MTDSVGCEEQVHLVAAPPRSDPAPVAQDPLTLAEVFEMHHDFVWRSMHYLGVPSMTVDDATQDVFLVVHKRLADFDWARPLQPWLFGISRRIADKHRVRAARSTALRVPQPTEHSPLDDELERREAVTWIRGFLERLNVEQREVFVLAELEGLRAPEIASTVGIKLNTVYSRLRLARQRFERARERWRLRSNKGDVRAGTP